VYPRHRIDMRARDLAFAFLACARRGDRRRLVAGVEQLVAPLDDALACLSVRSGFDLLLGALELPEGSEVVVSAITHPDMVGILELHRLRPVPVDLDLETLSPPPALIEAAVGPDTRAILLAPLFGSRDELEPIAEVARRHRLLLLDDRAQSLEENGLRGDPDADVSMFSFGPIKTATALGGAVLRVKDPELRERMRATLEEWPVQATGELLARTLKFSVLAFLARPALFGLFVRAARMRGHDLDDLLASFVRGFKVPYDDPAFTARIRRRPSAALLRVVRRRLAAFDHQHLARRAALGERLAGALPDTLFHPGHGSAVRTHWVLPVVTSEPARLVSALRRQGFDAAPARATSAITVVPAPPGLPDPAVARWLLEHVVFVPAYPELREGAVRKLVDALRAAGAEAPPVEIPEPAQPAEALA
jgi:perosamine synthetase